MNSAASISASPFPAVVDFDQRQCGDLGFAESREWLVTNGIGGYASGTVAGLQTRSYHGLLIAALQPPGGRTLLAAKLDETAQYGGAPFDLATNRWLGGAVSPAGFHNISRFHLEGTTPVWTFALGDALLEKRVFMQAGANSTYVVYRLIRASAPLQISIKALVDYCVEHCVTAAAGWQMEIAPVARGLRITAFQGATPFFILSDQAAAEPAHEWYRNFDLSVERARGLRDHTDHLFAGTFVANIDPGKSLTLIATTEGSPALDGGAVLALRQEQERRLIGKFLSANGSAGAAAPPPVEQLVLSANQFIASRPTSSASDGQTIIAGYPWFDDWARDTMIALPGLCLVTGRPEIARNILRTYARFVSQGMLPNTIPGAGEEPQYNTVDATLWYFQAVREYIDATRDVDFLRELFPVLAEIIYAHVRGTRYHIHVDPADGLLFAGQSGIQLTWMDAKIADWVVTPRIGKPIEVNALWLNAATSMALFARMLDKFAAPYEALAKQARSGFARFWNADKQFCFDVLDGPNTSAAGSVCNDPALRPNQIFAVSLPDSPLTSAQQRSVVDACRSELLTPFGLRSLGPREAGYHGRYAGNPAQRDAAYHQGTAWGWLLGPFALAHLRVYQDSQAAASFLEPLLGSLGAAGLGTLAEIYDGDSPFAPNGCTAQAWTVGEILSAWQTITKSGRSVTP
jgi:predicted glycogen debranching enzyme